jgi:hypothetical protein
MIRPVRYVEFGGYQVRLLICRAAIVRDRAADYHTLIGIGVRVVADNEAEARRHRMSIPSLNADGLLPGDIHDCTLDEIEEIFGNDRWVENRMRPCRSVLFRRLRDYIEDIRRLDFVIAVLVNGSFVTGKAEPGDIDLGLVVTAEHDFNRDLRPFEYNLVSKRRVKANCYPFDLFVVAEESPEYLEVVALFRRVKYRPDLAKGFLRVKP